MHTERACCHYHDEEDENGHTDNKISVAELPVGPGRCLRYMAKLSTESDRGRPRAASARLCSTASVFTSKGVLGFRAGLLLLRWMAMASVNPSVRTCQDLLGP